MFLQNKIDTPGQKTTNYDIIVKAKNNYILLWEFF